MLQQITLNTLSQSNWQLTLFRIVFLMFLSYWSGKRRKNKVCSAPFSETTSQNSKCVFDILTLLCIKEEGECHWFDSVSWYWTSQWILISHGVVLFVNFLTNQFNDSVNFSHNRCSFVAAYCCKCSFKYLVNAFKRFLVNRFKRLDSFGWIKIPTIIYPGI